MSNYFFLLDDHNIHIHVNIVNVDFLNAEYILFINEQIRRLLVRAWFYYRKDLQ